MKTTLIIAAGILAVLAGILVIQTVPVASVFAFIAGALAFGSAALKTKQ